MISTSFQSTAKGNLFPNLDVTRLNGFQKGIDKSSKMWYNNNVERERCEASFKAKNYYIKDNRDLNLYNRTKK